MNTTIYHKIITITTDVIVFYWILFVESKCTYNNKTYHLRFISNLQYTNVSLWHNSFVGYLIYSQAMLLYIYSDKLPEAYEVMGSSPMCTFTVMVQHLLAVADLYNLDRLKLLCESKLCEELNSDTVATTLVLADQHNCTQLKAMCLKFAANLSNLGGGYCP